MPPKKDIAEAALVQWLLDQANERGAGDWGHQKLVEFLGLRDEGPLASAYKNFVLDVVSHATATGSMDLRPTLVYEGRDLVRGVSIETFRSSIAGTGAQAYAMQLICEPGGSYYKRLRRCEYSKCRQFFLPEQADKGPLGKYHTDECRTLGPKEKVNDRVKANRLGQTVEEFRRNRARQEDDK